MSLKDRVAVVTGSTSGIGLGIAHVLASRGCRIVLNGYGDADVIESERQKIESEHGVVCRYMAADITDCDAVGRLIERTETELGRVDILVNNAGIQHVAAIEDFSVEKWKAVIDTNLSGVFYGVRAVLPGMKQRNFGRIINIASAHGLVASAEKSAYVAAKHGVIGLTKTIALETADFDITCNAICPGWVLTPLVQQQIDRRASQHGITSEAEAQNFLADKQAKRQFTTAEEVGELAAYLASGAARNVTGAPFSIDGGWVAR